MRCQNSRMKTLLCIGLLAITALAYRADACEYKSAIDEIIAAQKEREAKREAESAAYRARCDAEAAHRETLKELRRQTMAIEALRPTILKFE